MMFRPDLRHCPCIVTLSQVQLVNFPRFTEIRNLDAKHVSNLVCVKGIVVSASTSSSLLPSSSLLVHTRAKRYRLIHCVSIDHR